MDHRDLDSVETAKNEIIDQIRSLEKDSSDLETPISVSLDLQLLRQSERPEERSLADLVSAFVDLRTSLSNLETRIGTKEQQGMPDQIQAELRSLPGRLDEYFDSVRSPWSRRGRMHPMMLKEMLHFSPRSSPAVGILFVASFFRDSMPWIYELGVEVSRLAREGNNRELQKAISEFCEAVEMALHSPLRELFGRNRESVFIMEEIEPALGRALHMIQAETKPRPKRAPPRSGPTSS